MTRNKKSYVLAQGKPIDIFNQGGKGDILQLRATDNNSGRMYNALPKYSNSKWRVRGADGTVVIPFIVTGRYDASERATIAAAMKKIHQNTCIRFVPRTTERDFIDIQNRRGEGCYTNVGRVGGRGILMLESDPQETCIEKEIVLHELMHVIGLWHEHMRYDRDKYIKIMWMNIPRNYWSQFEKVTQGESSTYGIPYDYESVMHYGKRAFAYPGMISMKTKDPKFQNIIGRQKDASPNDWRKICAMYGCQSCMEGKAEIKDNESNTSNDEDNTSNDEDDNSDMDEVTEVIVKPLPT
ncbi:Metalloendopeptidase, partial [Trichostrongylus colubriformis]